VIFTDDHEPAHVHVFGDGQAKVNLFGRGGIAELVWVDAIKTNDLRRALAIIDEQRDFFLEKWSQIHG
jgi:Domain of unknown function (DUF4160)